MYAMARVARGGGAAEPITLKEIKTTLSNAAQRLKSVAGDFARAGSKAEIAESSLLSGTEGVDVLTQGPRMSSPSAYASGYKQLPRRLQAIDDVLLEAGDSMIIHRGKVSLNDIRYLSAINDAEYALLTRGSQRMIIRGELESVRLPKDAFELGKEGWRFSGHSHPKGANSNTADKSILGRFVKGQEINGHSVQNQSLVLDMNSVFDMLIEPTPMVHP